MAKGSGGVGKSKGKASVSGVAKKSAPTWASMSVADFGAAVLAHAKTLPKERGLVPISQVWGTNAVNSDMTLADFRGKVAKAFREGSLDLARQELVTKYSSERLRSSEVKIGGQEYYFIDTRGGGFAD